MLRVSPFLVAYAIFLLLTQYLFDLDFINEELVKIHVNMSVEDREQIGFSKSDFPVKELAIKVRYLILRTFISELKIAFLVAQCNDHFLFRL